MKKSLCTALSVLTLTMSAAATAAPFSEYKTKDCDGAKACTIDFSTVPTGDTQEIDHVSCLQSMTSGNPDVVSLSLSVLQGSTTKALFALKADWQGTDSGSSTQWWVANSPILAHLRANQKPSIRIDLDAVAASQTLTCTITGSRS